MPTSQPKLYWLSSLEYVPNKQLMMAVFANAQDRIVKKYAFFPFFDVPIPAETSKSVLKELFSSISGSKYRLKVEPHTTKILARDFSQIQKLHSLLVSSLQVQPPLLQPEQQFLCLQNWSYYDTFLFEFGDLLHLDTILFPQLPEFQNILPEHETACQQIAQSNLLHLPFSAVLSKEEALDQYLAVTEFRALMDYELFFLKKETPASLPAWAKFNLSKNTLNCACCKPANPQAVNCLPSTLVGVTFLEDGIFFDSKFREFAFQYHKQNPNYESRLRRRREFSLVNFPVGPFYRNSKAHIPLADALSLSEQGCIDPSWKLTQLTWACTQQNALANIALTCLNQKNQVVLSNSNLSVSLQASAQGTAEAVLQTNLLGKAFQQAYSGLAQSYIKDLSSYLANPRNQYSDSVLSKEIRFLNALAEF